MLAILLESIVRSDVHTVMTEVRLATVRNIYTQISAVSRRSDLVCVIQDSDAADVVVLEEPEMMGTQSCVT